jgi:hypothetical protein
MMGGDFTWLGPNPGIHAWAMATAAVVSASCALVGSLLVVRRMSLLGDAIGHAVLPGITHERGAGVEAHGLQVVSITVHALVHMRILSYRLVAGLGTLFHSDEQAHIEIHSQAQNGLDIFLLAVGDLADHPEDDSECHFMAVALWKGCTTILIETYVRIASAEDSHICTSHSK